ncbi:hypothetical protein EZ456_04990 [Pedobacter psychrodurus]|uniref:Uncharacterized protein n=1 Tax=Pedobacter psychrodurus TaxID=2530456 RepID=A0A4R0PZP3_9SPHI|nr:hypothetical protein [Pedobacter psychrodurus]TCD28740.1 hypothetical protein EZ456_04990 [Pedobacter psychrodurus]
MEKKITSIADELRRSILLPFDGGEGDNGRIGNSLNAKEGIGPKKEKKTLNAAKGILDAMNGFDCSGNTHMLHPRLDSRTVKLLNSFKLASGVDMNRFIAFSIHYLFQQHPELKTYIKKSLENFDL